MTIKEEIYELIKARGFVSFAELEKIDGFNGNIVWGDKTMNVIFWTSISNEAYKAMQELIEELKIVGIFSDVLAYYLDGKVLRLPIAKRANYSYKKWHWIPVVFNIPTKKLKKMHKLSNQKSGDIIRS